MTEHRKVRTCFWFTRRGIDAAQFYVSLLPDSRIDAVFDIGVEVLNRMLDLGRPNSVRLA